MLWGHPLPVDGHYCFHWLRASLGSDVVSSSALPYVQSHLGAPQAVLIAVGASLWQCAHDLCWYWLMLWAPCGLSL